MLFTIEASEEFFFLFNVYIKVNLNTFRIYAFIALKNEYFKSKQKMILIMKVCISFFAEIDSKSYNLD